MPTYTATEYLKLNTPNPLSGKWGQRWINALGGMADELILLAKDAVKASFPDIAPSGSLQYLSNERGIERYISETDASFRLRLQNSWETWKWAGTDSAMYYAMDGCGLDVDFSTPLSGTVYYMPYKEIVGYAPDGDEDSSHWARFWIIIDAYANGYTYPIDTDVKELWIRAIRKFKGSHSTCPKIYAVTSSGGFSDIIGPFGGVIGGGGTISGVVEEIAVGEP